MNLVALLIALTVAGQTQPPHTEKHQKIQTIDLTGETIEGARLEPEGTVVEVRRAPTFGTLVKVRQNFNDKLLGSVHEM